MNVIIAKVKVNGKMLGYFRFTEWGWQQAYLLLKTSFSGATDIFELTTASPYGKFKKLLGLNSLRVKIRELIRPRSPEKLDEKREMKAQPDWDRLTGP